MLNADQNLKLPKVLYIETTNRCNLRCKGCILYRGNWEPERDVSLSELIRITDQVPDLEQVYLHGIGEPLLNKELADIIRHLKSRKVYVLFNSNGILLNGQCRHFPRCRSSGAAVPMVALVRRYGLCGLPAVGQCLDRHGIAERAAGLDAAGQRLDVGEDGASMHFELVGSLIENLRSQNVRGKQVDRESLPRYR